MKKLLLVIDYQNDFVNGSLGFDNALQLENKMVDKIIEFEKNGDDIIFTLDTHNEDYLKSIEGVNLPVLHCLDNSLGHQLYGKVKGYGEKYLCIKKKTFGAIELYNLLINKEYEQIEICGVVTNICVISNAIICKSILPDTKIIILKDLCASFDLELEQMSYKIMQNLHMEIK